MKTRKPENIFQILRFSDSQILFLFCLSFFIVVMTFSFASWTFWFFDIAFWFWQQSSS